MSDIQRWTLPYEGYAFQSDDGGYVTYADHVAALLTQDRQHMEQQAAAEQRVRETNAVSCGVKRDRSGNVTACDGWHEGYEAGRRDEKAEVRNAGVAGARGFAAGIKAARDAVAALPWKVAVSFGPIDCNQSCEHGPCTCSGVMRPEAWMTGPDEALAAIDALRGEA